MLNKFTTSCSNDTTSIPLLYYIYFRLVVNIAAKLTFYDISFGVY